MKVRSITTVAGRFLNLDDIKTALKDDALMDECLTMLVVGDKPKPKEEMQPTILQAREMRRAIGYAISRMAGDLTEDGGLLKGK